MSAINLHRHKGRFKIVRLLPAAGSQRRSATNDGEPIYWNGGILLTLHTITLPRDPGRDVRISRHPSNLVRRRHPTQASFIPLVRSAPLLGGGRSALHFGWWIGW